MIYDLESLLMRWLDRQRWGFTDVGWRAGSQQQYPPRPRILDLWTLHSIGDPLRASSRRLSLSAR